MVLRKVGLFFGLCCAVGVVLQAGRYCRQCEIAEGVAFQAVCYHSVGNAALQAVWYCSVGSAALQGVQPHRHCMW